MTTNANQISAVLSGGSTNINVNDSLGGEPSSTPLISAVINNLFDNVSADESADGNEDYRCIYLFNDGDTSIYSIQIWIQDDFESGSTMSIGIENRNETQRITISGGVNGGSLTLSYKGQNFVTSYDSNLGAWSVALQELLNELEDDDGNKFFRDIVVTAQNAAGSVIFDIQFTGQDAGRNHDKFVLVANNFLPTDTINVTISVPQEGAPINTIAPEINVETTPPGGVNFFVPTVDAPITLPKLEPEDGFPLWIRRTTAKDTEAKENDGFVLRFRAQSLEPNS